MTSSLRDSLDSTLKREVFRNRTGYTNWDDHSDPTALRAFPKATHIDRIQLITVCNMRQPPEGKGQVTEHLQNKSTAKRPEWSRLGRGTHAAYLPPPSRAQEGTLSTWLESQMCGHYWGWSSCNFAPPAGGAARSQQHRIRQNGELREVWQVMDHSRNSRLHPELQLSLEHWPLGSGGRCQDTSSKSETGLGPSTGMLHV